MNDEPITHTASAVNVHAYTERRKVVHSGQVRIYYAAGCSCGWRRVQFRVTSERAREDWDAHVA